MTIRLLQTENSGHSPLITPTPSLTSIEIPRNTKEMVFPTGRWR